MRAWISASSCWALAISDHSTGKVSKAVESFGFSRASMLSVEDSGKLRDTFSGTILHCPFLYLTVNSNWQTGDGYPSVSIEMRVLDDCRPR